MRLPGSHGSADQYTVWTTDNNGNYISNIVAVVSGSSIALESFETSFHQDLNGDGQIGVGGVDDGDRVDWFDQPDRGWQSIFIFMTALGRAPR